MVEGDQMGRLTLLNQAVIDDLTLRFGDEIISNEDGSIIRAVLGRVAFSSASGRKDLMSITFPELYKIANQHFNSEANKGKIVVFDAALIYEWGVEADFDCTVVVNAPMDIIVHRASKKLNTTTEEIRNRISAQIPAEEKMRRADRLIDNDGGLEDLIQKAKIMWSEIKLQK